MSKERLEEIKNAYRYGYTLGVNTYPYWLISRVDELEQQNKRYREAIEDIKNAWKVTDTYQEYMDTIHDIINDLEDEE